MDLHLVLYKELAKCTDGRLQSLAVREAVVARKCDRAAIIFQGKIQMHIIGLP